MVAVQYIVAVRQQMEQQPDPRPQIAPERASTIHLEDDAGHTDGFQRRHLRTHEGAKGGILGRRIVIRDMQYFHKKYFFSLRINDTKIKIIMEKDQRDEPP